MNSNGEFFPLDPMQRRAVEAGDGVSVVIGATGTGKSHVLVGRVAYLLEVGVDPGHITCLTVQVEGAAYLRGRLASHPRIRGRLGQIFVGSLHDYARVFLRRAGAGVLGRSPDFTVWDRRRAVEAVRVAWPQHHADPVRKQVIVDALEWHWRNRRLLPYEPPYPAGDGSWLDVEELYRAEKARQNALDDADLLVMAVGAMDQDGHVKEEWRSTRSRHLLVDQAEDLTPRHFFFVKELVCPSGSLTVAADPNVGVFHHSPASAVELLRLNYPDWTRHLLRLDQASTRELNEMILTLQRDAGDGRGLWDHGQVSDGVDGSAPALVEVEGTLREMYTHAVYEARRLADAGVPWEDMAMLCRRGGVDRRLETQLIHGDIPHHVLGNVGQERPGDARLVAAMLTCLLNPRDFYSVRIAAVPCHPNRQRRLPSNTSRRLRLLAQEWGTHLVEAARRYLEELDPEDSDHHGLAWLLRVWDDLDRKLRDPQCSPLDLVLLALQRVEEVRPPTLSLIDDPQVAVLRRLADATPHQRGETPRMHLQRFLDRWTTGFDAHSSGLRQQGGLTLASIHAAKGLRWPVVFVLDVSDRTIPGKVRNYSERVQRELRLFYTAVTRATRSLYLYCLADTGRGAEVRPTRFLEPIMHLMERRRVGIREVWAGTGWTGTNREGVGPAADGGVFPYIALRDNGSPPGLEAPARVQLRREKGTGQE